MRSKAVGFFSLIVVLVLCGVSCGTIQSISASYLTTRYTANNRLISIGDTADIVVENTLEEQTTYSDGTFEFSITLDSDSSVGGAVNGNFTDGSLSIRDSGGAALLTCDIDYFNIIEPFNGILMGHGRFDVTGGSFASDFAYSYGDIVQVVFRLSPSTINDFSKNFSGRSDMSLVLVPEPATFGLLAFGGLMLCVTKRGWIWR